MNILQLSDPHLLAHPSTRLAARQPALALEAGIRAVLRQLDAEGVGVDRFLLTGDLCDDESWGGYVALREVLAPFGRPVDLIPGNHDHPTLLRAVMGRHARVGPAAVPLGPWTLVLLHSHRPACLGGWLGERQLAWLQGILFRATASGSPLLVAVHHPPGPIGDPKMDGIALHDGAALLTLLADCPQVKAVVFGHVHQHWQGVLPGRPAVPLLACPSTLRAFAPVQPCPLGQPHHPGARLLMLGPQGEIRHRLVRWQQPEPI